MMKSVEQKQNEVWANTSSFDSSFKRVNSVHQSYHEMADYPIVEMDVIDQLHSNVARLEDLLGRLSFMMKEISGVMKF